MANIGSEVERAILHKNKDNKENMFKTIEHALELLYLTIEDENSS